MKKVLSALLANGAMLLLMINLPGCSTGTKAVSENAGAEIQQAVESSEWLFTARNVMPQGARSRQVNGIYTVASAKALVVIYLPYFGRQFSGVNFDGKGPLDFSTTDFERKTETVKPGEWTVTINPKDNKEVQSFYFTFFKNGTASLNIMLTNRSGISYSGTVAATAKANNKAAN